MARRSAFLDGSEAAPPEAAPLRAGPLEMVVETGGLRYVRCAGIEVIRRIYIAVRDENWGTIPAAFSNLRLERKADSFRVTYTADHKRGGIHFRWHADIAGTAEGRIAFHLDGKALTTFRRNRIGICVHHPLAGCAGKECEVEHTSGLRDRGRFPELVAPHQPFLDIRAIAHEVAPGCRAEVRFEGEVFEMEDHRNWTDANYKTYSTPLSLPFPVEMPAGTPVRQSVTLTLTGRAPRAAAQGRKAVSIAVPGDAAPLPKVGLAASSQSWKPGGEQERRLRALRLAHVRVEQPALTAALPELALGLPLEVAVTSTAGLAERLREMKVPVARLLVFDAAPLDRAQWPAIPVTGGTRANFAELNRERPNPAHIDGVSFAVSPQVHAFDNSSLVENCAAQRDVIESARSFAGALPVIVSAVTLKPAFNPVATAKEAAPAPGTLPPQVDPRQMSLFGACWTLGSLKHLAEAGAASVTYYETVGWKGVMETEAGSPAPELFRSIPGAVFPVWHFFADVGEFASGEALASASSEPFEAECLVLRRGARVRALLANFTAEPVEVRLPAGLLGPEPRVRMLEESNVEEAMRRPEAFRAAPPAPLRAAGPALTLRLAPYALATIDNRAAEERKNG